ncbi:hypothetical protein [Mumia zhuanghuii]|nr:hypothetical protein [Mumia zhuanghuii]
MRLGVTSAAAPRHYRVLAQWDMPHGHQRLSEQSMPFQLQRQRALEK